MNSAIAHAGEPVRRARAMASAVTAGREAFLSGRTPRQAYLAQASSPMLGLIGR